MEYVCIPWQYGLRKQRPAARNFSSRIPTGTCNKLKQWSVEWGLLQMPQEKHWTVLHVLAIEDACNAEAVATITLLFSSVTSDDGEAIDSLKTCDRSRRWISDCRISDKKSLLWPFPSLDHSKRMSWGKRNDISGVYITPYLSPSIPRAASERVCACKSSFNFHNTEIEHFEGIVMFKSFWLCVKMIRSVRPYRSSRILQAVL